MAPLGIRRVLIIDDDQLLSDVMASIMRMVADDVVVAFSLKTGLDALESGPFSLVLLDLMLPDSRIYATLESIPRIKELGGRRVVAITASDVGDTLRAEAKECGAEALLSKNNGLHKQLTALFDQP